MPGFDPDALDRHITGNYGEDQFPPTTDLDFVTHLRDTIGELAVEAGEYVMDNLMFPYDQLEAETRLLIEGARDALTAALILCRVAVSGLTESQEKGTEWQESPKERGPVTDAG